MSQHITTPTFIIGLGGIGNAVARLVYQRYMSAEGQLPPTVRIRSFDTASQAPLEFAAELPSSMFTQLGAFNANQVIQHIDSFPLVNRWWTYDRASMALGYIENGAGAKRPVGRLVFFQEFRKIHEALYADFVGPKSNDVQNRLIEQGLGEVKLTPRVFIVGSIAGGTGAGMFLDAALLSRHLLSSVGYNAASMTGVFGLPSIIALASNDDGTQQHRERQVNASGALAELDLLMRGWESTAVAVNYPAPVGMVRPDPPILNQVFLFSASKSKGVRFERQSDVLQRVAHFVFGQVSLGVGVKTLQIMDNLASKFDPGQRRVVDGMVAIYGSFGVEWLEVPHKRLVSKWCEAIGTDVAAGVAEFRWAEQPRVNLESTLKSKLTDRLETFNKTLAWVSATPDSVMTFRGVQDVQPLVDRIQAATSKRELSDAVQAFDTQLPSVLEAVRRDVKGIPDRQVQLAWVRDQVSSLIADEGFRAGGARRFLEATAGQLDRVTASVLPVESGQEMLGSCGGGFLKRLTTLPAVDWAKRRVVQQARTVLANEVGNHATHLAQACRDEARRVALLQQAVRDAGSDLINRTSSAWEPPADSWMLDDDDISAAIAENSRGVCRAVVAAVAEELAVEVRNGALPTSESDREALEQKFSSMAVAAIKREATKLTKRPADTVKRIKDRMATCEPMAHIFDDGIELVQTMGVDQKTTPVKVVLTALRDEQRGAIDAWARDQRRDMGSESAFQVAESPDAMRDDALHLTYGWPLWLFREVRDCLNAARDMRGSAPYAVATSRVLGEVAAAKDHTIEPVGRERGRLLFAYALVRGEVDPVRTDTIRFSESVFGTQDAAISLDMARQRFSTHGLSRTYDRFLGAQLDRAREFKRETSEKVESVRSRIGQLPPDMAGEYRDALKLVEADLAKIIA